MKKNARRREGFLFGERGSYTLESTIIFPVIFVLGLFVLFFGLWVYQKVTLLEAASVSSMRAAHYWSNSHADPETGKLLPGQYDGLYWRVFDDAVGQIFGLSGGEEAAGVELPAGHGEAGGLPQRKLAVAAGSLSPRIEGDMRFRHLGFIRNVRARLEAPFEPPELPYYVLPDTLRAEAGATISDPVEFLRLLQLADTYVQRLRERNITRQQSRQSFEQFMGKRSPDSFRYHDHKEGYGEGAGDYLPRLVGGEPTVLDLPPDDQNEKTRRRKVDALDAYGVAHQAFVTFTNQGLREQMEKDAILMEIGKVNGVVWHFFKRTGETGRVGPSAGMKKELEAKGIVVVIHD